MKIKGYKIIREILGEEKMRDEYVYLTKRGEKYYIVSVGNVAPYHLNTRKKLISEKDAMAIANATDAWNALVRYELGDLYRAL